MRWKVIWIAGPLIVGYYWMQSFGRFTHSEMDWNKDGETTLGEILVAGDYGRYVWVYETTKCERIVRLKDGAWIDSNCVKRPK